MLLVAQVDAKPGKHTSHIRGDGASLAGYELRHHVADADHGALQEAWRPRGGGGDGGAGPCRSALAPTGTDPPEPAPETSAGPRREGGAPPRAAPPMRPAGRPAENEVPRGGVGAERPQEGLELRQHVPLRVAQVLLLVRVEPVGAQLCLIFDGFSGQGPGASHAPGLRAQVAVSGTSLAGGFTGDRKGHRWEGGGGRGGGGP